MEFGQYAQESVARKVPAISLSARGWCKAQAFALMGAYEPINHL